jgi:hypothetical protein
MTRNTIIVLKYTYVTLVECESVAQGRSQWRAILNTDFLSAEDFQTRMLRVHGIYLASLCVRGAGIP